MTDRVWERQRMFICARKGEREKGRKGEREKGRKGEREKGR